MHYKSGGVAALIAALSLQGCGGASASVPAVAAAPSYGAASQTGMASHAGAVNRRVSLTALPLDDYRYESTGAKSTWIYLCANSIQPGGPGSGNESLPWVNETANTWDMLAKVKVEGAVSWASRFVAKLSGARRAISGNGLPSHATGTFPIASSDPAYQYDQNPNRVASQTLSYDIPSWPAAAAKPSCLNMGAIGVMLTGAVLFNGLDAQGRDAAAHEVLDDCWGHPQQQGQYHYHTFSSCMSDPGTGHSNLLGYALDGFGIYGPRGESGAALSDADLDACHGHTHAIRWNGKTVVMYHYHMTYDYPYSLGCYRGTPVDVSSQP